MRTCTLSNYLVIIYINGFHTLTVTYTFHKPLAQGNTSWECVIRRCGHCKARIKLSATAAFIAEVGEHSQAPSTIQCGVTKIKAGIKRCAETTNGTTQWVLSGVLLGISEGAATNLPPINNIQRTIHRRDIPVPPPPSLPRSLPLPSPPLPPIIRLHAQVTSFYFSIVEWENPNKCLYLDPQRLHVLHNNLHIGFVTERSKLSLKYFTNCTPYTQKLVMIFSCVCTLYFPTKLKPHTLNFFVK